VRAAEANCSYTCPDPECDACGLDVALDDAGTWAADVAGLIERTARLLRRLAERWAL
jgi:hypothetical protein